MKAWDQIDYWELRKLMAKVFPRTTSFYSHKTFDPDGKLMGWFDSYVRKKRLRTFNLKTGDWVEKHNQLSEMKAENLLKGLDGNCCYVPLQVDIWDGMKCPFNCKYCYADNMRASLYRIMFDEQPGHKGSLFRHYRPEAYKKAFEIFLSKTKRGSATGNALQRKYPIQLGCMFENFAKMEKESGVALGFLQHLAELEYPVLITTKSSLVGTDKYIRALKDNKAGAFVLMSLIPFSSEEERRDLEPGAHTYKQRLEACRVLIKEGIPVIGKVAPSMVLFTDGGSKAGLNSYMDLLWESKIRRVSIEHFAYSTQARGKSVLRNMVLSGVDFQRLFSLTEFDWTSSLLMEKFVSLFRKRGFHSVTTDQYIDSGTADSFVCCGIEGMVPDRSINWGWSHYAIRFIIARDGKPTAWSDFEKEVVSKCGGFLSDVQRRCAISNWNRDTENFVDSFEDLRGPGLVVYGQDKDGLIWRYDKNGREDFRMERLRGVLNGDV